MTNITSEDLIRMRLVKNADGSYSPGPALPTEFKAKDSNIMGRLSEIGTGMRKLKLTLLGEPMPKQSVRSFADGSRNKKTGNLIVSQYQPKEMGDRVKDYRRQICQQLPADFIMFTEIVHVRKLHFVFAPLKSFSKKKGKMDKIHAGEIIYKTTRPDLHDNLKKLIFDSLSDLIYKDDGLVATENNVAKYYGRGGMIIIELEGK